MKTFRTYVGAALLGLTSLVAATSPASAAAPCRDTHGRFIKCAAAAPAKRIAASSMSMAAAKPRAVAQSAPASRMQTAVVSHRAKPTAVTAPLKPGVKASPAVPHKG